MKQKVTILDHTSLPISYAGKMARTCYSKTPRMEGGYSTGLDCLESGHGRVFEYPDVTMKITGISARVARELYTHVIGTSRLQESTRYIKYEDFQFYTPASIKGDARELYESTIHNVMDNYNELLVMGCKKEDVANLLPLAMETGVVLKINLRALLHMFEVRTCTRALREFRVLMETIRQELTELDCEWEELCKEHFEIKCEKLGYCPENKKFCCGKYKTKEMVQNG